MKNWFWITFDDNSKGTIAAASIEEATEIANKVVGKKILKHHTIYRPAHPILHQTSDWPAFCYNPEKCFNRCEAYYSCVD